MLMIATSSRVEKQQMVSTILMNESYLSERCLWLFNTRSSNSITKPRASIAKLITIPDSFHTISENIMEYITFAFYILILLTLTELIFFSIFKIDLKEFL